MPLQRSDEIKSSTNAKPKKNMSFWESVTNVTRLTLSSSQVRSLQVTFVYSYSWFCFHLKWDESFYFTSYYWYVKVSLAHFLSNRMPEFETEMQNHVSWHRNAIHLIFHCTSRFVSCFHYCTTTPTDLFCFFFLYFQSAPHPLSRRMGATAVTRRPATSSPRKLSSSTSATRATPWRATTGS